MTRKNEFTNRHGKKVKVEAVDQPAKTTVETAPTPKPPTRRTLRWPKLKSPRISKRFLVVLAVLVVALGVAVIVTADGVKRDYERQTAAMKRTVADWSKQATSADISANDQLTQMQKALSADTSCQVEGIDVVSWYGPAKVAREACQSTAVIYKNLQVSIDDMSLISSYLSDITAALEPALAVPGAGEFAIIADYADAWSQAVAGVQNVSPPENLTKDHAAIVQRTQAVADAWQKLQSAHSGQNAEAFNTAEEELNQKYGEFRSASDGIELLLQTAQSSISRYAEELS